MAVSAMIVLNMRKILTKEVAGGKKILILTERSFTIACKVSAFHQSKINEEFVWIFKTLRIV
jgi:hypothetical protein